MRSSPSHPDQLLLELGKDDELERIIERRVAIRAEADAWRWRLRLVLIETLLMATLIVAAGIALDQPRGMVVRSALAVGGACFVSGLLLIGLSGVCGRLVSAFRRWRQS